MRLSLTAAPFKGLPAWTVLALWRWLGVDRVEVTSEALLTPNGFRWAGKGLSLGLHLPNVGNAGYDFSSPGHDRLIKKVLSRLAAPPLPLEYAIIHPPEDDGSDEAFDRYLGRLRQVAVPLMLENLASTSLDRFMDFDGRLTEALGHAPGICLDVPHALLAGEDWRRFYREFRNRIGVVHLSDCLPPEDSHRPFGFGVVNLAEIIDFLGQDGFRGVVNLELSPGSLAGVRALGQSWMDARDLTGWPVEPIHQERWSRLSGLAERLASPKSPSQ